MNKIIEGKRYNTETATEVADWNNGYGGGDFHALSETLYRTKKGSWFLLYTGGAMTYAARSCGNNSWCGSRGIKVLSDQEANEWLEAHDFADELEEYFADQIEDA